MPKTLNETQQRKLAQHFAIENPEATAILRAGGRGTGLAGTIAAAFEEDYPELVARIRSGDTGTATATVAAPSVQSPVATRTLTSEIHSEGAPAPQPAVAPAAADPIAAFEALVAAKLQTTLLNRNSAIAAVSREHPVAHAKYVAAVKQRWGIR